LECSILADYFTQRRKGGKGAKANVKIGKSTNKFGTGYANVKMDFSRMVHAKTQRRQRRKGKCENWKICKCENELFANDSRFRIFGRRKGGKGAKANVKIGKYANVKMNFLRTIHASEYSEGAKEAKGQRQM
jgi:hypothetical protein